MVREKEGMENEAKVVIGVRPVRQEGGRERRREGKIRERERERETERETTGSQASRFNHFKPRKPTPTARD